MALEPNMDLPDDAQDEEGITLREALGARKTFVYIYDYGYASGELILKSG